jgi:hypothetical protein
MDKISILCVGYSACGGGGERGEGGDWELQATATAKKSAFEGLVGDGCGFWEIQNSGTRAEYSNLHV